MFASFALAQQALDPICYIQSIRSTCIENLQGDTIYVNNNMALFGNEVSFCPEMMTQWRGAAQIVICIDRSGSMNTTDSNYRAITVAKMFLDSIAKKSPESKVGIVVFGAGNPDRTGATGIAPLTLAGPNLPILKSWVDSAGNHLGYTPYGAALDTARRFISRLPATDTTRAIIFLSDGEPCLPNTRPCRDTAYTNLVSSGLIGALPPVHTVYFHTGTGSSIARDTLRHLAGMTEGTFTDVNNANNLATVFLDSLFTRVLPVVNVWNFHIANLTNGQESYGSLVNSDPLHPAYAFRPLYLEVGPNLISCLYERRSETGVTAVESKSFTIWRRPGSITAAEQTEFNQYFTAICSPHSSVIWQDSLRQTIPTGGHYDSAYRHVYIQLVRGPGTSGTDTDSVVITTPRGEREVIAVIETAPGSNIFRGMLPIEGDLSGIRDNGILEVRQTDTLYAIFKNPAYQDVNGNYYDIGLDTILCFSDADSGNIPIDTTDTGPFTVITRDTNGNGYIDKLELAFDSDVRISGADTAGLGAAFTITEGGYTWRIAGILPMGTISRNFELNLVESGSASRMETDLLPAIRFNSWMALTGLAPNTSASNVLDGCGPVIRRAVLNDNATSQDPSDDRVTVEWSEPIAAAGPFTSADQVFRGWTPDSATQSSAVLSGCAITVSTGNGQFTTCNPINGELWISIDSARSGIADTKGNHVSANNHKVIISLPRGNTYINDPKMIPNPGDYEFIRRNGGSSGSAMNFSFEMFGEAIVTLRIYDLAGNLVRKLSQGRMGTAALSGILETVPWDGTNGRGRIVNRGGYVVKFYAEPVGGGKTQIKTIRIAIQ